MKTSLLLAIALVALSSASYAQRFNSPDSPCRNMTGSKQTNCFVAAAKTADAEMDQELIRIRTVLSPEEAGSLRKAQELWGQSREADCVAERRLFGEGTAGPLAYYACLQAEAKQRLVSLEAAYGWRVKKFSN